MKYPRYRFGGFPTWRGGTRPGVFTALGNAWRLALAFAFAGIGAARAQWTLAPPVATAAGTLNGGFTAHWGAVATATNYRLDVATDPGFVNLVSGYTNLILTALRKDVTGIAAGVPYYYRVRAYNGTVSGNSNAIEASAAIQLAAQTYSTPGNYSYSLPANTNRVLIKAWGAGGNASGDVSYSAGGGAGGFVLAAYPASAGQSVSLHVGSAAGEVSAAWVSGGFQVIAAGGGDAGGYNEEEEGQSGAGGSGGPTGTGGADSPSHSAGGGGGGTVTGPGSGGGGTQSGSAGTGPLSLPSGSGYNNGGDGSGRGGGGYYGGGGGGSYNDAAGGGGGGGSNLLSTGNLGAAWNLAASDSLSMNDPDYSTVHWYGIGGGAGFYETGRNGAVVIKAYVVPAAPVITVQPTSQMANAAGASVTFTVTATGFPPPTFQWKKDGVAITGATGTSHTIASVQTGDLGNYVVVVTNMAGSVTSTVATLTIDTPPTAPTGLNYIEKTDRSVSLIWGPSIDNAGAVEYSIYNNGAPLPVGTTSDTVFIQTGLSPNQLQKYTVIAKDNAGLASASSDELQVTTNASATADNDADGIPDLVETALGTTATTTAGDASNSIKQQNVHRPVK